MRMSCKAVVQRPEWAVQTLRLLRGCRVHEAGPNQEAPIATGIPIDRRSPLSQTSIVLDSETLSRCTNEHV